MRADAEEEEFEGGTKEAEEVYSFGISTRIRSASTENPIPIKPTVRFLCHKTKSNLAKSIEFDGSETSRNSFVWLTSKLKLTRLVRVILAEKL